MAFHLSIARALLVADKVIILSPYHPMRKQRYASFDNGKGRDFEKGKLKLEDLRGLAERYGEPDQISGKQEWYENMINQYI